MAIKAFMTIETDNIETVRHALNQQPDCLIDNCSIKSISNVLCYDANSKHDKPKLSILAEIIDDILPEELSVDEQAKLYLLDDETTDLYDAVRKLQEALRNMGY